MRMWEIRENEEPMHDYPNSRKMRGYRDSDYECGYEDGYRAAMKEAKEYYSDRRPSKY